MKKTLIILTSIAALAVAVDAQTTYNITLPAAYTDLTASPSYNSTAPGSYHFTSGAAQDQINTAAFNVAGDTININLSGEITNIGDPIAIGWSEIGKDANDGLLTFDIYDGLQTFTMNYGDVVGDHNVWSHGGTASIGDNWGVDISVEYLGSNNYSVDYAYNYDGLSTSGTDSFTSAILQGKVIGFGYHTKGASVGSLSTVPEPSSTALLGLGGLALIMRRKRS